MKMSPLMLILALVLLVSTSSCAGQQEVEPPGILKTLRNLDQTRAAATTTFERVRSITVAKNATISGDLPIFNFAMLMPFTAISSNVRTPIENGVVQGLAAVLLAIEHLNSGNGTIVKEVAKLNQRCAIRFSVDVFESLRSQSHAVDQVINLTLTENPAYLPSAFLGAARSAVSIPTAIITGLRGYPQISPLSTSTQLDDVSQFPLFGRTIPSDAGTAVPAILYLRYELGVKHLVVLHVNDAYGNAYALGLQLAAAQHAPDMVLRSYDFPFDVSDETIAWTVSLLKDTQFRYFFGIIFSTGHYDRFMTEAYNQGIAGTGEHFWMFSDSVSPSKFAENFEAGSPLHLASKGSSRLGAVGGVPGIELYDRFLQSMADLNNPSDIAYIQSKHPSYPSDPDYVPSQISDDPFFFDKSTAGVVSFLYDSAIALGLAACSATNDDSFFDGQTLFNTFKNTTFSGASGQNLFNSVTGTRTAESARFTLLNFVEDNAAMVEGTVRFKSVESDVFRSGKWFQVHPIVFNDGSTEPPLDLPPVPVDNNFIGSTLRAIGLVMSGTILSLALGFAAWTSYSSQSRVVRASQPIFLLLICAGCFLMGSTIIFLSIDDEVASDSACTVFCIVIPWLGSVGWSLTFSALLAKTNRVNQIFHSSKGFKRVKVTKWDVMKPVIVLVAVTSIILTVWTIIDPPVWTREVSSTDAFGRGTESKGFCMYEGGVGYIFALLVVLLGVLAYAMYEAYVARNVSTEFAESEYIFLVLSAILLVSFLGIPVMILAKDDTKARAFVAAGMVFVVCSAALLLIFIPKILALNGQKGSENPALSTQESRLGTSTSLVRVSGLEAPPQVSEEPSRALDEEGSEDEDGGIIILQHPKDMEEMRDALRRLASTNELLIQKIQKLKSQRVFPPPGVTASPGKIAPRKQIMEREAESSLSRHSKGSLEIVSFDLQGVSAQGETFPGTRLERESRF